MATDAGRERAKPEHWRSRHFVSIGISNNKKAGSRGASGPFIPRLHKHVSVGTTSTWFSHKRVSVHLAGCCVHQCMCE